MAKVLVTRPRLGRSWDTKQRFDILLDGAPAAPIGLGQTIQIELTPGPHGLGDRFERFRCQPMVFEAAPDAAHRFAVGPNVGFGRLFGQVSLLASLPFFGLAAWFLFDAASMIRSGTMVDHLNWQMPLLFPSALLALMPEMAYLRLVRDHALVLCEVPSPDLTDEEVAGLLRARPFHVRITIWQAMIAVALLAISFWASLQVSRSIGVLE
jgi:hypothetical protein